MVGGGSALFLAEDSPAVFFRVYLAFSMFLVIFQCVFSVFNVFVIMAGGKNAGEGVGREFFPRPFPRDDIISRGKFGEISYPPFPQHFFRVLREG